jgi:hypothetical protein
VGDTPPLMTSLAVDPVAKIMRPPAMMVEPSTGRLLRATMPVMSVTSGVCTVTLEPADPGYDEPPVSEP